MTEPAQPVNTVPEPEPITIDQSILQAVAADQAQTVQRLSMEKAALAGTVQSIQNMLDAARRDIVNLQAQIEDRDAEIEALLDDAVAFALDSPHPDPEGALDFLYATGLRGRSGGGW